MDTLRIYNRIRSASNGTSSVLGPVTYITIVYNIVIEEIIKQALGRTCHVWLISWVFAGITA